MLAKEEREGVRHTRSSDSDQTADMSSPLFMCRSSMLSIDDTLGKEYEIGNDGVEGVLAGSGVSQPSHDVRRATTRATSEKYVPYMTFLILRIASRVPGGRLLMDSRVIFVLGGAAVVATSFIFTAMEKFIADKLDLNHPVFMQILVLGMATLLVELFTGRHGLFIRSQTIRTVGMLPLVALYMLSMVFSHTARNINSVHGTFQVVQATLPIVVMSMLGFPTSLFLAESGSRHKAIDTLHHSGLHRSLVILTRGLRHLRHRLIRRDRSAVVTSETCVQPEGSSSSRDHADLRRFAMRDAESDIEMDGCGYLSGTSSVSSFGREVLNENTRPSTLSHNPHANLDSGRGAIVALVLFVAVAIWSPKYVMSETDNNYSTRSSGILSMGSLLNLCLSVASVICNSMLLVGISNHLHKQPDHSPTTFVRHFAPLCMLSTLILWPMLESPVDVLEDIDVFRLSLCLGVAAFGALSLIARLAMLQVPVNDGPVGVAAISQINKLVCLAIGWWICEYEHWQLQIVAFCGAWFSVFWWILRRITADYSAIGPFTSFQHYQLARARKCSSADV
ncbi:hypothetical protein COEREDRAFT_79596 [Coemansia reversa NRRL 1564]|uniref:Uncharacterized protein n=1 Tax=Coemansia reversa (strain ATCC 12441 / NRRL 1564) TaxID=763665 RepID=A0A2G5BHR1_COERN|nr:hypothetical protein COEREDRAFT_79596 [Coemansia reversa NRRL 1564]|eukprot:PIA18543.1 hypothetical protein COEREDRAFT_79596 [Coemansia reversa NRRL 1564]